MNILFIGDIFGKPGREAVRKLLPQIKEKYAPDLTIANGENLTHGKGALPEHVYEMQKAGIDFFTSGNHIWKHNDTIEELDDPKFPIIRPANYPPNVPGRGYKIIEDSERRKVLVINLLGRIFMKDHTDCPFRTVSKILANTADEDLSAIIVDFHAEASSEKIALGHFLDGKVSAVIGTHTHVPTADLRILNGGTAYVTDTGMVGPEDSIIGLEKDSIIKQFLTQLPVKHDVSDGRCVFNAVLIKVNPDTMKAESVEHIFDVV